MREVELVLESDIEKVCFRERERKRERRKEREEGGASKDED